MQAYFKFYMALTRDFLCILETTGIFNPKNSTKNFLGVLKFAQQIGCLRLAVTVLGLALRGI